MEPNSSSAPVAHESATRRNLAAWFAVPALVPILAALTVIVLPNVPADPSSKESEAKSFVLNELPINTLTDSLKAAYDRTHRLKTVIRAEEAFLAAKTSDGFGRQAALWIDLHDSVATLSIQGVPVRISPIAAYEKTILFDRLRDSTHGFDSLEVPFALFGSTANIPRMPVREVHAPKDTAEARLRPPDAFVTDEGEVFAQLYFDRNVVVYLTPPWSDLTWFDAARAALDYRLSAAGAALESFLSSDHSPAPMWVRLQMSSADIRAIYRAVPEGGRMSIRW
ncbi:MAG TPA: hypothetical protein VMO47_11435 [Rhodothermales bacterium]|nr:hypothetical protein [Rhodothermales bacterium]